MKNTEFIELLNLYLDHEISAADAARLEAEVMKNPERRRVYQQYCQMQRACKLLTVDFRPAPAAVADSRDKTVVALDSAAREHNSLRSLCYTAGGLAAAAACVALIFSGHGRPGVPEGAAAAAPGAVAIQGPASQASTAPVLAGGTSTSRGSTTPSGLGQRPMLVSDPLLLGGSARAASGFVSSAAPADDELAWVRTLQLTPLQARVMVEDLHFDSRPATLRPEVRVLGVNNGPIELPSEMNAFRFVK